MNALQGLQPQAEVVACNISYVKVWNLALKCLPYLKYVLLADSENEIRRHRAHYLRAYMKGALQQILTKATHPKPGIYVYVQGGERRVRI